MTQTADIIEPDYHGDMALAPGVTCDDCTSARRCFALGFSEIGRTSCDFWPNRFRASSTRAGGTVVVPPEGGE